MCAGMADVSLWAGGMLGALAVLFVTREANAGEVTVEWSAPAGCPTAGEVTRRAQNVGRKPPDANVTVYAHVQRMSHSRFQVHLEGTVGRESWTRDLEAENCNTLADAAALVVAITASATPSRADTAEAGPFPTTTPARGSRVASEVSRSGTVRAIGATPTTISNDLGNAPSAPSDQNPATSAAPLETRERPNAEPSQQRALRSVRVAPMVSVETGSVPKPAPGVSLALAWVPSAFRAELEAGAWAQGSATLPSRPNEGGHFRLVAARARVCETPRWLRVSIGPCAGVEVDYLTAASFGTDVSRTNSASWFSASAGLLGNLRLASWLSARTTLDATLPLARTSFVIEGRGTVHRVANISPRASLGLEMQLP